MERFNSLQKEVETLKKKEAHRRASKAEAESSAEGARSSKASLLENGGTSAMKEQQSLSRRCSE